MNDSAQVMAGSHLTATGSTTSSYLMHAFLWNILSIRCTHSTPDVTHTLGQVGDKILCSNLIAILHAVST
jgi:hypothetical protein